MVQVRQNYAAQMQQTIDLSAWAQRICRATNLSESSLPLLLEAANKVKIAEERAVVSDNIWSEHTNSFVTGLEMADILADLQLDQDALIAAVIYRSVREEKITIAAVQTAYGDKVVHLIEGVLRMAAINSLRNDSDDDVFGKQSTEQVENVRKMLVSMVDDVRIALIKLAERTCAIRAVKNEKQRITRNSHRRSGTKISPHSGPSFVCNHKGKKINTNNCFFPH